MKSHREWAVHTHIGVFWDGGVRLLAVYRWWILAIIHCWWHVRFQEPMRVASVHPVSQNFPLTGYHESFESWEKEMELANAS